MSFHVPVDTLQLRGLLNQLYARQPSTLTRVDHHFFPISLFEPAAKLGYNSATTKAEDEEARERDSASSATAPAARTREVDVRRNDVGLLLVRSSGVAADAALPRSLASSSVSCVVALLYLGLVVGSKRETGNMMADARATAMTPMQRDTNTLSRDSFVH